MARRKKGHKIDGWININKPVGVGSTEAVTIIKRALRPLKIGHGGTLDPLASGVLPIALGEATKTIPYCQDAIKKYEFVIKWGQRRTTDDAEGETLETSDVRPDQEQIEGILDRFIGEISQIPPQYSAIKIDGKRAYDIARAGEIAEIKPRNVYIEDLRLTQCLPDEARFECVCGKGTYIRSIARDMAQLLGTQGYIKILIRHKVGAMELDKAFSLAKFEEMLDSAPLDKGLSETQQSLLDEVLLPPQTMLDDIPALAINEGEAAKLKQGRALLFIARPDIQRLKQAGIMIKEQQTVLTLFNDKPVALVTVDGPEVKPIRVLNM